MHTLATCNNFKHNTNPLDSMLRCLNMKKRKERLVFASIRDFPVVFHGVRAYCPAQNIKLELSHPPMIALDFIFVNKFDSFVSHPCFKTAL